MDFATDPRLEVFREHRPLLFSIAYRMLGSAADAEDIVQEAYLRWLRADQAEVRSPKDFLAVLDERDFELAHSNLRLSR